MLWVVRDLKGHPVPAPAMGSNSFHRLLQAPFLFLLPDFVLLLPSRHSWFLAPVPHCLARHSPSSLGSETSRDKPARCGLCSQCVGTKSRAQPEAGEIRSLHAFQTEIWSSCWRSAPRSPQLHAFSVCDFTLQSTGFLGAVADTAHLCALTQGLVDAVLQQFREQTGAGV